MKSLLRRPSFFAATALATMLASLAAGRAANLIHETVLLDGLVIPADPNPSNLGTFDIVIVPSVALASNGPALAAFNRAAMQWESRIADSITVTINADFSMLDPGVLGSASSVTLQSTYATVRNQMILDSAGDLDDSIVGFLPAAFTADFVAGTMFGGNTVFTKANGKALNFGGLDAMFGASDGSIAFSTGFSFDFDNSDGVTPGFFDFETVAAHEIGHTLGFTSRVDVADTNPGIATLNPTTLDLFRFQNNVAGKDPATNAEFTMFPRNLMPNVDAITDEISLERRMSTGRVTGDGNQASHWKADELNSSILIGIMDPTLSPGFSTLVLESDFRAMDLIGYNISPIPEPDVVGAALLLLGLAGWDATGRRRLRRGALQAPLNHLARSA